MRTIEQVIGWAVMLILVFLILSRAAEANTIINTLGGFAFAETRNLQGYDPSGKLSASPATSVIRNSGFTVPGGNPFAGIFGY